MFVKFKEKSINLAKVEMIVLRKTVIVFKFEGERQKEIIFCRRGSGANSLPCYYKEFREFNGFRFSKNQLRSKNKGNVVHPLCHKQGVRGKCRGDSALDFL